MTVGAKPASISRFALRTVLLLAAAFWLLVLRPVSLGGPAGYVVVAGSSMEPALYSDTLVVTMAAREYARGDVVAFRLPGVPASTPWVIHRITGGSAASGFLTQGDNVALPDPWRVMPHEIVGRQVAALPQGGRVIRFVRAPITLATLAAGMATYVLLGWLAEARRRDGEPSCAPVEVDAHAEGQAPQEPKPAC